MHTDSVVEDVSYDKCPKHDSFDMAYVGKEQCGNKYERYRECNISCPSELFSRCSRSLIEEKIRHHCRPASISAPASSEDDRTEYFGNCIMDSCRFNYSRKNIVPKSFYLHILIANEA